MQKNICEDLTIIIRTVGERTTAACVNLVKSQGYNESLIHQVNISPFQAALKECFRIGIRCDRKWTLCIDADILPGDGSIKSLIKVAEQTSDHVLEIQPLVCDQFFGGLRTAGVHLYRTSLLERALDLVPEAHENLRPENEVLQRMRKIGYPYVVVDNVFGLHDFEQSYKDIYRKCKLHGSKHTKFSSMLVSYWSELNHCDFRVAEQGLKHGIASPDVVATSSSVTLLETSKLPDEKPFLPANKYSLSEITEMIDNFEESQPYREQFKTGYRFIVWENTFSSILYKFQVIRKKFGWSFAVIILIDIFTKLILHKLRKIIKI